MSPDALVSFVQVCGKGEVDPWKWLQCRRGGGNFLIERRVQTSRLFLLVGSMSSYNINILGQLECCFETLLFDVYITF